MYTYYLVQSLHSSWKKKHSKSSSKYTAKMLSKCWNILSTVIITMGTYCIPAHHLVRSLDLSFRDTDEVLSLNKCQFLGDFIHCIYPQRTWDKEHYRHYEVSLISYPTLRDRWKRKTQDQTKRQSQRLLIPYCQLSFHLWQHPFRTSAWSFHITTLTLYATACQIYAAFSAVLDFLPLGFWNRVRCYKIQVITTEVLWSLSWIRGSFICCIHLHLENRFVHRVIVFLSSFVYPRLVMLWATR